MAVENQVAASVAQNAGRIASAIGKLRTVAQAHPVAAGAVAAVGVMAAGYGCYKGGSALWKRWKRNGTVDKVERTAEAAADAVRENVHAAADSVAAATA